MRDDDQTLITRFRYLTGKRPLGGFGSAIDRSFDDGNFDLRGYINRCGAIGGGSIGDEYRPPWFSEYLRHRRRPPPRLPPAPMWWDQPGDQNMTLIEDRAKPKSRFYRPDYWPGVFGVEPKKPKKQRKRKKKIEAADRPALRKIDADRPAPRKIDADHPALNWDEDLQEDAPLGASVAFQCDNCRTVLNTYAKSFVMALACADTAKWFMSPDNKCWCPDCQNRNQTAA